MSRYIDWDRAAAMIESYANLVNQDENTQNLVNAVEAIVNLTCPIADMEEVKIGTIKWVNRPISAQYATVVDTFGEKHYGKIHDIIENNLVAYCGECGKRLDDTFMNYCPNCGAKMVDSDASDGCDQFEDRVIENITYCKDCKYLMFSDCYAECGKAYKGIVSVDDFCDKGKSKRI